MVNLVERFKKRTLIMDAEFYMDLKRELIRIGYSDEIDWQTELKPITDPIIFRNEAIWVILNSGMKMQVASLIQKRIWQAVADKKDIATAFGHKGKVCAIKFIMAEYEQIFRSYLCSTDKLSFLQTIPFIGGITKYHLAKNLGHDVIKPDRHLVRIAKEYGYNDCNSLCKELSNKTGDKVCVIDIVLWRAANLGKI